MSGVGELFSIQDRILSGKYHRMTWQKQAEFKEKLHILVFCLAFVFKASVAIRDLEKSLDVTDKALL